MKPMSMTYTRRFNLGDYQHEEVQVTAEMESTDTISGALEQLKQEVLGKAPVSKVQTAEVVTPKKAAKKEKPQVDPEPEEQEEVVEKVAAAPAKKFKKKQGTPYMRTNEAHKAIFTEVLAEEFPNWKKKDVTKAQAKKASQNLDGVDFLDADGEVLESFKDALREEMD